MDRIFQIISLICISSVGVLGQYQSPTTPLQKDSALSASYKVYETSIHPYCVSQTSGQQRIWPTGQSMENLIALIERLEIMLENDTDTNLRQHLGAENVAKLILRRFRFDGYDPTASSKPYQNSRDTLLTKIANAFFPQTDSSNLDQSYYFPDKFFNQAELCSLYQMLSHNVFNTEEQGRVQYSALFRGKRQAYNNRQQYPQQNYGQQYNNQNQRQNQLSRPYGQYAPPDNPNTAVQSKSLIKHPIKEEGVVSFRGNQDEAIAPARVLVGVIAGLSTEAKTSANAILKQLSNQNLREEKQIDPVMALTIADLWGVATENVQNTGQPNSGPQNEKGYYYGLKGQWSSGSCTTHYALTDVRVATFPNATRNMKATKAELRGGIDGYLIGKNLKSMTVSDPRSLRLSTILRSYYSKPRIQKSNTFTVGYCNRDQQIAIQDINAQASAYAAIMNKYTSSSDDVDQLLQEFTPALTNAQQKENTNVYSDYCSAAPGVLDDKAPCETPSDVIYIVDATSAQKLHDSATIVSGINGNLINMRTEGGTVSIFANSPGQNSVNSDVNNQLPRGTEQWPLVAMAFNSTNTGYAQCRIDDFNTTILSPVPNTGKYLKFLNQTLFFYEWWNPRTNASAVPSKTAVLIDFDSVPVAPDSGNDRNDYNYYKDQLRYRHRDVKYLSFTNNLELFKDILREDSDKDSIGSVQSSASQFAQKICDNPATFQYNACNERKSDNVQYIGFVTPGYKQNWAMYPEFFLKSFDIYFKFKPEDGDIRVCFDRWFPPQRQDSCRDIPNGKEETFRIENPCKGKSFSSCDPFYFTVWGKDRTSNTQCLDSRCLSLDQIKFTVSHTGVQCSSSYHLLPSITFQLISLSIFAILYQVFNK